MRKRTRTCFANIDTSTDASGASDESYDASNRQSATQDKETRRRTKRARTSTLTTSQAEQVVLNPSTPVEHPTSWHVVVCVNPIRNLLLDWYNRIHDVRGMPWRKAFDESLDKDGRAQRAYEVWVSEIMLQQTQVVTVIPYYNKWMAKFPTIKDLAASDIDTVNSLWKGLGYYSRAARLLKGAQKVVNQLGGRLPDNAKDMQQMIPGIGRYSAGAICSIAYNQCVPVLDGNVIRLLTRFLALYAPPKSKQAQDILWAGAEAFVKNSSRPGDINQALIELGSTICKVRDPVCMDCPLQPRCRANQKVHSDASAACEEADIEELCTVCKPLPIDDPDTGLVTIYPMKIERKKAREELDSVNVIEWRMADDRARFFLLVRRPEGGRYSLLQVLFDTLKLKADWYGSCLGLPGLLAGLHEFPTVSNISGTCATAAKVAEIPTNLLNDLLSDPPSSNLKPLDRSQKGGKQDTNDDSVTGAIRIVHVKPAGDVVHVFSHIRKTYRVQWVLLEGGGDEPPELQQKTDLSAGGKTQGVRSGKHRKHSCDDSVFGSSTGYDAARWVLLDQVKNANIGTGVMKVWTLVQTLWL